MILVDFRLSAVCRGQNPESEKTENTNNSIQNIRNIRPWDGIPSQGRNPDWIPAQGRNPSRVPALGRKAIRPRDRNSVRSNPSLGRIFWEISWELPLNSLDFNSRHPHLAEYEMTKNT